ncbi:MAG: hypothetical protein ABI999_05270 [Acidobacteriota bacterium]
MKMNIQKLIAIGLMVLGIGGAAAINAQYTRSGSNPQIRTLLTRIATKTDAFKTQANTWRDRNRYGQNNNQNNGNNDGNTADLSAYVADFQNSTNRLTRRFDAQRAADSDVSDVLTRAAYIDQFISENNISRLARVQWTSLRTDLNRLAAYYRVSWNWHQELPPYTPGDYNNNDNNGNNGRDDNDNGTGTGRRFDARLTGTYKLNTSLSDNVSSVIDRSMVYYSADQKDNMRQRLERRLASPEMISIEKTGTSVTMSSSNAQQVTFLADGLPKTETNDRGRTITTTATSDRQDGFAINYTGERSNDFYVSFNPTRDGQLKVTRRIYLENRSDQVTVSSVYDKTEDVARWDVTNGGSYPGGNNGGNNTGRINDRGFGIVNGTQLVATLRSSINTQASQANDRFSMEVTSPNQYRGAILEGRVIQAQKSGRVSGRANISLDFDTITMPGGQTYKFAGIIDGATAANGDSITVNNEGTVRDSNQTTKTATRAGIGAGIGAIIGAIAGGGTGAAIGAGVGAGAGAGTVLVQGRDNIDLGEGSTFRITATGPSNVRAAIQQ